MGLRSRTAFILLFPVLPILKADAPAPANPLDPAALKKLSLEQLSRIEVTTPSKEPVRAFDTPSAIFVITGEDLRRSGVTSIPEALRLAPGVEVARIDANHWSIGIRGFGTRLNRSVLVLIDGRTVYTPLFDGTYWEVQDTLLEDVDRIEVIRGPGGTIWGPNAVNGVINIITKQTKDTRGAFVSMGGGNEEQGFVNARYGGGNDKGFDYRFYGKGFTDGPEYHINHDNYDDWRSMQGGFRMDWTNTPKGTFTLQGDMYDEAAGEITNPTSYTAPYSTFVDSNALLSGGNILGRWSRTYSDSNDVQVQVYYDRTNRHEANLGELRNTFDVDFLQRLRLPARNHLTWGLGARVQPVNDIEVVTGLTFVPEDRTDYLLTGFVQDEIGLVDRRLSVTIGTKILQTNFLHGVGLEPSARIGWTPNDNHTIWAAYTHALRTPSDAEENFYLSGFVGDVATGSTTRPGPTIPYMARFNANTRFAPEEMNGYELGYRELVGKHFLYSFSGFYNHYHDLFDEEFAGPTFFETTEPPGVTTPVPAHFLLPAQFGNGLLAYTKGIDGVAEVRPASIWSIRGTYSYLHMNVYKSPHSGDIGTAPGIMGASPEHQAMIDSQLDVSKRLQIDVDWRFVSSLPSQGVPWYSTADARIGWRLNDRLEFSLVGRNLAQHSHYEDAGDGVLVGIERSGYAQLAWRR